MRVGGGQREARVVGLGQIGAPGRAAPGRRSGTATGRSPRTASSPRPTRVAHVVERAGDGQRRRREDRCGPGQSVEARAPAPGRRRSATRAGPRCAAVAATQRTLLADRGRGRPARPARRAARAARRPSAASSAAVARLAHDRRRRASSQVGDLLEHAVELVVARERRAAPTGSSGTGTRTSSAPGRAARAAGRAARRRARPPRAVQARRPPTARARRRRRSRAPRSRASANTRCVETCMPKNSVATSSIWCASSKITTS